MTTYAALYMSPSPVAGEAASLKTTRLAQLIACRVYAEGRGYAVRGVYASPDNAPERRREVWLDLVDWMQTGAPASKRGEPAHNLVVVVYDAGDLLLSDGSPDPIAQLIAAFGVRVESVLGPHTAAEINEYFAPEAVQLASRTMRDLLGSRGAAWDPSLPTAGEPQETACVQPPDEGVWNGLLHLLADERQVRALAASQRAAGERQDLWTAALAGARSATAEAQRRRTVLLDLLLEGAIDKSILAARRALVDVELRELQAEERTAHAHLGACTLAPEQEELVVEICRHLHTVLSELEPEARQRVAHCLQLHTELQDDGRIEACCLLPLTAGVSQAAGEGRMRKRGRHAAALPGAAAEDYPLRWTVEPAAVHALGAAADLGVGGA